MTSQQAAELAQPSVGSLDNPATLVTSQLASIFVPPFPVVVPVRRNQFNTSLLQPLAQWVGIVAAVGDHALRFLPRPSDQRIGNRLVRRGSHSASQLARSASIGLQLRVYITPKLA